jgi:hypothetical protein
MILFFCNEVLIHFCNELGPFAPVSDDKLVFGATFCNDGQSEWQHPPGIEIYQIINFLGNDFPVTAAVLFFQCSEIYALVGNDQFTVYLPGGLTKL